MEKFILYMKEQNISDNTCNSYANDIKLYKKYYKDSFGEDLTNLIHEDISMYRSYLLKHNISAISINRKISALKMYNEFLVHEDLQEKVIIIDKDYIKVQKSMIQKQLPSERDINMLKHFSCRDKKNSKRDFCIIILLLYAGLRESELVNLRIVDIKLEERFLNIIGKGNKFRQVMINNLMYNALKDYLDERQNMNIKNPYLIIGQKNKQTSKPLNRNFCNRLLNKYKEICKINYLHPHLLRSYFCSNALHNAGYTIEQVANQAGHSSLNTTKGYLISEQKDLLKLSNLL
jgi:integrase/recombinase XerD